MVATTRSPTDPSLLSPSKFQLTFIHLPAVIYFCQRINIPGVGISTLQQATPFVNVPLAGSKFTYDPLQIEFLVDENLTSWKNIYDWLKGAAPPKSFREYNNNQALNGAVGAVYSDATLTINTDLNNPNFNIFFKGCFPTTLSSINFDSTRSADDVMTATAIFEYEYYEFQVA